MNDFFKQLTTMAYSGRPFEILTCKLLDLTLLEDIDVSTAAKNNLTCINGYVVDDGIDCVKLDNNKITQIYQCKCYTFPYSKITKRKLITYLKYVRNYKFKDVEKFLVISDRRTISLKLFKKLTDLDIKIIEIDNDHNIKLLVIDDVKYNGYLINLELSRIKFEKIKNDELFNDQINKGIDFKSKNNNIKFNIILLIIFVIMSISLGVNLILLKSKN